MCVPVHIENCNSLSYGPARISQGQGLEKGHQLFFLTSEWALEAY